MGRLILFAALGMMLISAVEARGLVRSHGGATPTYYVAPAPTGSDSNPGTLAQPFATLAKAQTAMQGNSGSKITYLRAGTYVLTSPLTLTSADNSETWASYPGENAIVSGGTSITGWTVHDSVNNIYQATGVTWNFRELYVNGVHATRARGPTLSAAFPAAPTGWAMTSGGLTAPDNSMVGYGNPTSIEVFMHGTYSDSRCLVSSIASGSPGATITMQQPCWGNVNGYRVFYIPGTPAPPYIEPGLPTWWENAYEFLVGCGQGCWYLDTTAQILYYIPRSGENMATVPVVAPRYSTLITGSGVSGLYFLRLTFAYANNLDVSTGGVGYPGVQGGYTCPNTSPADGCVGTGYPAGPPAFTSQTNLYPLTSPILFSNSSNNVTFDHCLFTHIAGQPVFAKATSQNFTFTANVFTDNGGGGSIQWGDITDHAQSNTALQTSGLVFRNNSVGGAFEYLDTTGFNQMTAVGSVIDHNHFDSAGYSSISIGLGWDSGSPYGGYTNYGGGQSITNNLITNYNILPDGGAIYQNGHNTGAPSTITGNYINGANNGQTVAIYMDLAAQHYTIQNNVIDGAPPQWWFNIDTPQQAYLTATGNYTVQAATNIQSTNNINVSGNPTFTTGSPPGPAVPIINNAGIQAGVTPGP